MALSCQTALSNQANAILLWIFVHVCSYLAALKAFLCVLSTAAKPLLIAFKLLHSAAPNSQNLRLLQPASLQLFCSASWSHSAALQQRCAFRTGRFSRKKFQKHHMRQRKVPRSVYKLAQFVWSFIAFGQRARWCAGSEEEIKFSQQSPKTLKMASESFIHALLLFLGLFLKISLWVLL